MTESTSFRVGQKVVKIKCPPESHKIPVSLDIGHRLVDGEIYEIRWVGTARFIMEDDSIRDDCPAVRLVGFNRVTQSPLDPGQVQLDVPWSTKNFRPLQENLATETISKTIELFRQLAKDVTEGKVKKLKEPQ